MKNRGFSLIELLVALAVVVIVTTLAVPSFSRLVDSNRVETAAAGLSAAAMLARSEAIKRGTIVALCAGSGVACGTDWGAGWTVFLDADRDCAIGSPADVLRTDGGGTLSALTAVRAGSGTAVRCVQFSGPGYIFGLDGGVADGVLFRVCGREHIGRRFELGMVGRGAVREVSC